MGLFGRKKKVEMAKDPVCGMDVEPMKAAGTYNHGDKPYWFCSKSCLEQFTATPGKYVQ